MIKTAHADLSTQRRCELLYVARSTLYYQSKELKKNDTIIMNEIREIYQETPFYGYRKITVALRKKGVIVNHKKVHNLMQKEGMKAIYARKKTSIRNPDHKVFPYLLLGLKIDRPNQVWQVDITYIKIRHGFVYLVCLIDVFSRKIMGWSLSTFLDTNSCLEALYSALKIATPEIINSDQGCQFTSNAWVNSLLEKNIKISMDGKKRWVDNVFIERFWRTIKYENVFLHSFDTVTEARLALGKFIHFYNEIRFHQKLNYHTPNIVYSLKKIPTKKALFAKFACYNKLKNRGKPMISK